MLEKLKEKFGDCKFQQTSVCTDSYEHTTVSKFYVFDPLPAVDAPSKIVDTNEPYQLTVTNKNNTNILFVKTDKCLFENDIPKCDCILFNDEKLFLVEIKNSSSGTRKDKRKDAIKQLGATVQRLIDNNIPIENYEAKAIVCFKRENEYPIQASKNTQRAIFLEKYKMMLGEGNIIEF